MLVLNNLSVACHEVEEADRGLSLSRLYVSHGVGLLVLNPVDEGPDSILHMRTT